MTRDDRIGLLRWRIRRTAREIGQTRDMARELNDRELFVEVERLKDRMAEYHASMRVMTK